MKEVYNCVDRTKQALSKLWNILKALSQIVTRLYHGGNRVLTSQASSCISLPEMSDRRTFVHSIGWSPRRLLRPNDGAFTLEVKGLSMEPYYETYSLAGVFPIEGYETTSLPYREDPSETVPSFLTHQLSSAGISVQR